MFVKSSYFRVICREWFIVNIDDDMVVGWGKRLIRSLRKHGVKEMGHRLLGTGKPMVTLYTRNTAGGMIEY